MVPRILTFPTALQAAEACGARTLQLLSEAFREGRTGLLAVSGGTTPRMMFEWMARQNFDWSDVHIFWVDERCVHPDHEMSNFRMTQEALLDHIAILPDRIHRIQGELPPADAARAYSAEIREVAGDVPVFDVIQRGMGADSHTASLFPGEPLLLGTGGIAAAVHVEKLSQDRVTLLPGVLQRARHTLNLVVGGDKKAALTSVLRDPVDLFVRPAQIASLDDVWFVDEAAFGGR